MQAQVEAAPAPLLPGSMPQRQWSLSSLERWRPPPWEEWCMLSSEEVVTPWQDSAVHELRKRWHWWGRNGRLDGGPSSIDSVHLPPCALRGDAWRVLPRLILEQRRTPRERTGEANLPQQSPLSRKRKGRASPLRQGFPRSPSRRVPSATNDGGPRLLPRRMCRIPASPPATLPPTLTSRPSPNQREAAILEGRTLPSRWPSSTHLMASRRFLFVPGSISREKKIRTVSYKYILRTCEHRNDVMRVSCLF